MLNNYKYNCIYLKLILFFSKIKKIFKKKNNNNQSVNLVNYDNSTIDETFILPNETFILPINNINQSIILPKINNKKILYFALIIESDKIIKILNNLNLDLNDLFSNDLTFKSEYHVTLWYAFDASLDSLNIYLNDIKHLIGTIQTITITDLEYNIKYCRLNVSFSKSNEISNFFQGKSNENTIPHITLVHPNRDAKGAGTFIPIDSIKLDEVIETKLVIIVKNDNNIQTITNIEDLY